jgi:rare lipoprotein A
MASPKTGNRGNFWLMSRSGILAVVLAAMVCGCASGRKASLASEFTEEGKASWYGQPYHGRTTASGEKFDMHAMTAAHPRLAFGSVVRVTNTNNSKSVEVRINDHYPGGKGRVIDLSRAAFSKIASLETGVVPVRVELVRRAPSGKLYRR